MACKSGNCRGPGYASPEDAIKNGPKEELLYVVCVQPNGVEEKKPDYLATVDVNPTSPTYSQVIYRTYATYHGDELHHSGWNVCSSCHTNNKLHRDKMILPSLKSDRIYVVDMGKNPRAPEIYKVIEPSEMHKFDVSTPHTTHCLASGELMVSTMGDKNGNGKGDFLLIDATTFKVKGTWTQGKTAAYGYDFWYQPYWDVMVSTEWGAPRVFKQGYKAEDVDHYGSSLNFYSWSEKKLIQTIDLGVAGFTPLEIRFLHNPKLAEGYVGCALNANIFYFHRNPEGKWEADLVIDVKPKKISTEESGKVETVNGMITDILISMDDKYLYFNNWLHGDVRQYDISDRKNPKLTAQIFLGGKIMSDLKSKVVEDQELSKRPDPVIIKGKRLNSGPQMLQLSLDGKRLYVSSSLFSPWDKIFYPDGAKAGAWIVKIDIDVENGGMTLDNNFLVDFGKEPNGPAYAHEMRYPGGDCTSDIWLSE